MNTAPLLLGIILVVACTALPGDFSRNDGHRLPRNLRKLPRLTYDPTDMDAEYIKCSKKTKKVTLKSGSIVLFKSPEYPDDYPKKSKCKWQFKSKEDLTIACFDFELEKEKNGQCNSDFLQIDSERFCGSQEPFGFEVGKSIKVEFRSNKKKNYRGFNCLVTNMEFSTSMAPSSSSSVEPSEEPTEEPPTSDCKCGQANRVSRIVGGEEVEEHEYPWQVALVWKGTSSVFCGGSIIGSRHILTAAHCIEPPDNFDVLAGAHDTTDPAPSQIRLTPAKWTSHENYNSNTLDNDVAIVKVKETISFTREVSPVCLPANDDDDYDDVDAIVSGWGNTKFKGKNSDVLLEVTVPTMTNEKCSDYLKDMGGVTSNMLCAGHKKGKKDSCQNDSGGPLTTKTGSFFTQIGVVSWGDKCAQPKRPGVYARVTRYLDWIAENSDSSTMCPSANIESGLPVST